MTRHPPRGWLQTLRHLGPGLLVAATVVGAGELIATTRTGAQAGFAFLWLIVVGCVIKAFVQVELGRYAISSGETTLRALDHVPGPRYRTNWVVWLWFALMPATFVIMGGVIGGVGQALALAFPVLDDRQWVLTVASLTAALLAFGRYGLIEKLATALVALFTVVTVVNVVLLQFSPYRVPLPEIAAGLAFQLPEFPGAWLMALATFGIIGVGAVDLIAYPYWCLEKGYGRYAGRDDGSTGWPARAQGWIRVMRIDAFVSVAICAVSTLAFYFIGAAVLHKKGLDPDGMEMISTLIAAYEPVFGANGRWLLLSGALAVLYSSFLIATAAAARLLTDGLSIVGALDASTVGRRDRFVAILSVILAIAAAMFYWTGWNPVSLIVIGGLAQTILLPVVGFSSIWLRYRRTDRRLSPGRAWDVALILSCVSFVAIGGFGFYQLI